VVRAAYRDVRAVDADFAGGREWSDAGLRRDRTRRFGLHPVRGRGEMEQETSLLAPRRASFVVARPRGNGEPVACGALARSPRALESSAACGCTTTGAEAGLGSRLLRPPGEQGPRLGHGAFRLEPNARAPRAISMYQRAGTARSPVRRQPVGGRNSSRSTFARQARGELDRRVGLTGRWRRKNFPARARLCALESLSDSLGS